MELLYYITLYLLYRRRQRQRESNPKSTGGESQRIIMADCQDDL